MKKTEAHPGFAPAIFHPHCMGIMTKESHQVLVRGKPRSDYRLETTPDGQSVIFDYLSYDEACSVEIVKKPQ